MYTIDFIRVSKDLDSNDFVAPKDVIPNIFKHDFEKRLGNTIKEFILESKNESTNTYVENTMLNVIIKNPQIINDYINSPKLANLIDKIEIKDDNFKVIHNKIYSYMILNKHVKNVEEFFTALKLLITARMS